MAKFTGPKGKIVRRFGVNIYGNPKYDQLLQRRSDGPGQQGAARKSRRPSDYALQLIEKQKLRHSYGLLEKQFRRAFQKSQQQSGVTGDNLLVLLETRLDTVVFRAGLSSTQMQARQLVNHGHLKVNDQRVDIASFQVKPGDSISLRQKEKTRSLAARYLQENKRFSSVDWLTLDRSTQTVRVNRLPQRDEIQNTIDEKLIVEFYSK
ncbi:MAG TPA: 30S ribosomal protein S4 [Malonomonas sp.]